jgi:RNA polymerase-interacting CarD/CdnL/TRCF family regulator
MVLTSGSKVVYPSQGPCLIGPLVEKNIGDRRLMFYQLVVLGDGGGELFVPEDKLAALGVRPLLERSEIPGLLDQLKMGGKSADTWRERGANNLKLMASGSAFDLAEIVASLTVLRQSKALSFRESKSLERARRLLVCEISEVMGESVEEADERVSIAFQVRSAEPDEAVRPVDDRAIDPVEPLHREVDRKEIAGQKPRKPQRARAHAV